MEKNILKSVILLSVISICGCSGGSDVEETVWGQEVKEESVRISPEVSYELPDTIYAMSASVYKGRYAVCPLETQKYSAVLYDLQEGRVVNQFPKSFSRFSILAEIHCVSGIIPRIGFI